LLRVMIGLSRHSEGRGQAAATTSPYDAQKSLARKLRGLRCHGT